MTWPISIKAHLPGLMLIIGPFAYYYWFIKQGLHPVEYPDSFAYLWRQDFNVHYLTGRSLTQRVIFGLSGNKPRIIWIVQLGFYLLAAVVLYVSISKKVTSRNIIKALLISIVFSSYTLNMSSVIINSEPIFVSLIIIFFCLVVLYRGPYKRVLASLFGILYIFSKNIAPYTVIFLIIIVKLASIKDVKSTSIRFFPNVLLLIVSIFRMSITNSYDTSVHLNVLGNMYRRVFINEGTTRHFHEKYSMPIGPFVERCRGEWVGVPCFGHHLLTVNSTTRNYELAEDEYGFVDWIEKRGQRSYLQYLLFDSSLSTSLEFAKVFHLVQKEENIRFMIQYIGVEIPENDPNNLSRIKEMAVGQDRGFLGFDSLSILHGLLLRVGFGRVELVLLYSLVGLVLLWKVEFSSYLSLGVSALTCSLVMFFLTFYGSAMEVIRHVFPALLLLVLGGVFYLVGVGQIVLRVVRHSLPGVYSR